VTEQFLVYHTSAKSTLYAAEWPSTAVLDIVTTIHNNRVAAERLVDALNVMLKRPGRESDEAVLSILDTLPEAVDLSVHRFFTARKI